MSDRAFFTYENYALTFEDEIDLSEDAMTALLACTKIVGKKKNGDLIYKLEDGIDCTTLFCILAAFGCHQVCDLD